MKRKDWIDALKGILILCVVLGHEVTKLRFVYWFHMPLFFMVSGYLLNKTTNIREWFIQKAKRFLIPYFSFYILISVFGLNKGLSFTQFAKLIYGGRQCTNVIGVWWYPSCLLFTILASQVMLRLRTKPLLICALGGYLIGLLEWKFYLPANVDLYTNIHKFPWNIDVCFMSVPFVVMAFYCKGTIDKLIKSHIVFKGVILAVSSAIITLSCIGLQINTENFNIDMKYSQYGNPFLFVIFPILFGIVFLVISDLMTVIKPLNKLFCALGYNSMIIMYLHVPMLYILRNLIRYEGSYFEWLRAFLSLGISLAVGSLLCRFRITKYLFATGDEKTIRRN